MPISSDVFFNRVKDALDKALKPQLSQYAMLVQAGVHTQRSYSIATHTGMNRYSVHVFLRPNDEVLVQYADYGPNRKGPASVETITRSTSDFTGLITNMSEFLLKGTLPSTV
jgi:hypothetical protein